MINDILYIYHLSFIIHHQLSFIIYHLSYIIYHLSYIIYHTSFIIYHISFIIYHLSYIIYHISFIIIYHHLSYGKPVTVIITSIPILFPSHILTRDKKACMGEATLPANSPLQKDKPTKKEETKNVPSLFPGNVPPSFNVIVVTPSIS